MNKFGKNILISTAIFIVVWGLFSLYSTDVEKVEKISFSQLVTQINQEQIKEIEVEGEKVRIEMVDGKKEITQKEGGAALLESLGNFGVESEKLQKVNVVVKDTSGSQMWLTVILPFLLPFMMIAFFIWFLMKQAQKGNSQAMGFGSSKARMLIPTKDGKRLTFKDVAGAKEAKEELYEIVEFLQKPKKFLQLGAKIPKGALLLGSPGTGKTLMAKAVAGEAGVPFFSISGSEFVEMFVGVGASRVRDLFKQAKKNSPSIVFIDEVDAVGRHRGAGVGGGNDEREQTLNQILVEMDGFDTTVNVIVIAATNRPDVLDPALLRPGRFDRRIVIDKPDIEDREAILKVHAVGKPLAKGTNLRQIAERTPGFSGADLANLMNEGAILAARREKKETGIDELREAIEKVILGPERKSHILSKEEKKVTAYHEAGHALVAKVLPDGDSVQKVSIISRGQAAGYTLNVPKKDKSLQFKSYYLDQISILLAGYVVEEKIFGEVTTGASNDLERATAIARKLVTRFGMSDLGPMTFGKTEEMVFLGKELHEERNYSEQTAQEIDLQARKFIHDSYESTKGTISENMDRLEAVAKELIIRETLEKEEFDAIMKGEKLKKFEAVEEKKETTSKERDGEKKKSTSSDISEKKETKKEDSSEKEKEEDSKSDKKEA
ncbi:ATP-dependent zinc metalloprotease FtsH [bacterium]|nr:ATP-dependent zinc metalloprotease FtsH [bacterium]MBT4251011.1 ATP-dependent zinc metalloprotease FtsH [bacterium]MBT4597757.1 ATP-dependent zinc metalloprotease FtsH [bacterium]MBT6753852.1 ATP-dependent zinc metalloprotease FtsH [bacterium]MBT7037436.1 ATP-dependent zinc metalloprotease FtsH [bacterium]